MEVRIGKHRQLLGVRHRQGTQQHRIEHAEDGGVGADAQRQCEYGNHGEARAVRQHARGIPQVFLQGFHGGQLHALIRAKCGQIEVPA